MTVLATAGNKTIENGLKQSVLQGTIRRRVRHRYEVKERVVEEETKVRSRRGWGEIAGRRHGRASGGGANKKTGVSALR